MQQTYILFDLDGTLTDPGEGITKCVAYALEHFGISVPDLKQLYCFIGPPLKESFQNYYHLDEDSTHQAIELYRQRFDRVGWQENIPYAGMIQLLQRLKQHGKHLLVATSKPESFAVRILEHFGMAEYFDAICGAPMDAKIHSTKATVIQDALKRGGITDRMDVIMVGDRLHDVEGAHENGIPAIGVTYGYGDRAEHVSCGADYIAATMAELQALLLNERKEDALCFPLKKSCN